jgi:hypothetical protein
LTNDGVSLISDDGLEVTIGFSKILCDMRAEDRAALVRALNMAPPDEDDTYEPFYLEPIVREADPTTVETWGGMK